MKLRMLKPRHDDATEEIEKGRRGSLRVVEGATTIYEWPHRFETPGAVDVFAGGGVEVSAEVQTKRFHDRDVESERFTATLRVRDDSPAAILAALADACAGIEELRAAGTPGDRIIMQISLRA